jgi:hypothetical protein
MQRDVSINDLVRNLRRVGLRPDERLIASILEHGENAIGPLLDLALDRAAVAEPEPASLGPLHALRLLGELKPIDAAEPLLNALPLPTQDEPTQGAFLWAQEVPQIVANFGPKVLLIALRLAADADAPALRRGAAAATLGFLAATKPDLRPQIVTGLRERLREESDPTARGYIVATLAQLGASEAYSEIMAAYAAKNVDRNVMPPGDARQLLLGSTGQRQLDCALHTLPERYEQHGPYSEEQQRAMAEMARAGR